MEGISAAPTRLYTIASLPLLAFSVTCKYNDRNDDMAITAQHIAFSLGKRYSRMSLVSASPWRILASLLDLHEARIVLRATRNPADLQQRGC